MLALHLLLTAALGTVCLLHVKKVLRILGRRQQPRSMDQGLALCILTSGGRE
jgi:hypothetical protein